MVKYPGEKKRGTEDVGAGKGRTKSPKPAGAGSTLQRTRNAAYTIAASVSLLTFLVYVRSLHNEFVNWDDSLYVFENRNIRSFDLAFLKWAFFDFHAANWHPLTWISHAVDYALWGLNSLGHHLTNNILHAANTFLVVVLTVQLLRMFRERAQGEGEGAFPDNRRILIAGGVTGLLFGLHPLHVESVAWVAERKDLLCGFFSLLSVLTYVQYARRTDIGTPGSDENNGGGAARTYFFLHKEYLAALGLFALALLSKPMAVSLPLVLLILDWYPFERIPSLRSFRRAVVEKAPFLALSVVSSILTIFAQRSGEALRSIDAVPLSSRLAVAVSSLIGYLGKMIAPLELNPYYAYPEKASFLSVGYLVPLLLVLGISLLCLRFAGTQRLWLSAWGYYVITLLPVLGIVQVGGQSMADRYTYLPSLGPFLVAGVLAAWVSMRTDLIKDRTLKIGITSAMSVLFILSLVYVTAQQIGIWKNNFTLWDHVIKNQRREVAFVYYHRGLALMAAGRIERAIKDFDKAIDLDPADHYAYINRGMVYCETGQTEKALEDFDAAIALDPRSYVAFTNKGLVYGRTGSFDRAIEHFSKAIEIKPDSALAYGNRGLAYSLMGRRDQALDDLNRAIQLDATYTEAYGARGNIYLAAGDWALAFADFRKACDLGDTKGCDVLKTYGR